MTRRLSPDYPGVGDVFDYEVVTSDNLPPDGEYRTPDVDFVTYFQTKWKDRVRGREVAAPQSRNRKCGGGRQAAPDCHFKRDSRMTDRSAMQATLDAYFDRLNEERYDEVAALFADHAELIAPGTAPRRGEDLEAYFRAALRPYPEHRDQPTRVILADSTATVEITFTGALESGEPMEFDAIDVFDFDARGEDHPPLIVVRLALGPLAAQGAPRGREQALRDYLTAGITSCPKRRMHSNSSSWLGPCASRRDMIR